MLRPTTAHTGSSRGKHAGRPHPTPPDPHDIQEPNPYNTAAKYCTSKAMPVQHLGCESTDASPNQRQGLGRSGVQTPAKNHPKSFSPKRYDLRSKALFALVQISKSARDKTTPLTRPHRPRPPHRTAASQASGSPHTPSIWHPRPRYLAAHNTSPKGQPHFPGPSGHERTSRGRGKNQLDTHGPRQKNSTQKISTQPPPNRCPRKGASKNRGRKCAKHTATKSPYPRAKRAAPGGRGRSSQPAGKFAIRRKAGARGGGRLTPPATNPAPKPETPPVSEIQTTNPTQHLGPSHKAHT